MFAVRRAFPTAAAAASTALFAAAPRRPARTEEGVAPAPAPEFARSKSSKKLSTKLSRTKSSIQSEAIANSKLYEAYRHEFGDKKMQLSRNDLANVLLGCGILDDHIVDSTFTVLRNRATAVKKKAGAEKCDADKVPYSVFYNLCKMLAAGDNDEKINFMFDFIDLDKSDLVDKNEISVVVRHLLFCRTNWYGEDILFDGPEDMDLFFEVPTESITQLKANKYAHDLVTGCHGGARQAGIDKKTFKMWFNKGGKKVVELKNLFSALGVYEDSWAE